MHAQCVDDVLILTTAKHTTEQWLHFTYPFLMWKTPRLPQHHPEHEHSCLCSLQPVCEWTGSYIQKCYRRDLDYTRSAKYCQIDFQKIIPPPKKNVICISSHSYKSGLRILSPKVLCQLSSFPFWFLWFW